jgi:hypothetical protein
MPTQKKTVAQRQTNKAVKSAATHNKKGHPKAPFFAGQKAAQ